LHAFFDRIAFHIFHQPTRLASFMLYPMAFHPPPLRGRFMSVVVPLIYGTTESGREKGSWSH
jgi:hypothetical protein